MERFSDLVVILHAALLYIALIFLQFWKEVRLDGNPPGVAVKVDAVMFMLEKKNDE